MRIFVSIALAFFALCSAAQAQSGCNGQTSSGYICGNSSASTGLPGLVPSTSLFDRAFGSTPGTVLNRTTSWGTTSQPTLGANGGTGGAITLNGATSGSVTIGAKAAAGTSTIFDLPVTNGAANNVLITDGAGNTSWVSAGSGTVSSVGLSMPGIFTVTNSPVVTTGTLTATLNTQSANLIWGGPSTGAASAPTFRSLVGADLPNPSASTLGGVQSFAAVTSQWIRQISTSGVPTASQPAFSDISGVAASTQLPNPTATTLGGIESYAAVSNQWINTISTSGVPSSSQPGFSNLSGQASLAQLPGIGSNTVLSNTTGGTATPLANSLSSIIDSSMGSTQGDVLYRNATGWAVLAPGAGGQVLTTGGAAANPSWTSVAGTGTVTSIATNNGITGGTISSSGTIGLANITTGNVMANVSGGTTYPTPTTPSAVLDVIGSTQGSILYRGASAWLALTPGTNGQLLATGGAGSTPSWTTPPTFTGGYALMTPHVGQTGGASNAWLVHDMFGNDISSICAGTQSQCLKQFIQYASANGQPARLVCEESETKTTQTGVLNGTNIITGLSNTALFSVGDYVVIYGANNTFLPSFTQVTSIDSSTQIHVNNAATGSATVTLNFTNTIVAINASEQITFPPLEDWWFEASQCNITFSTAINGPGFSFDSVMASHFVWNGIIVYQPAVAADSYIVEFRPVNPVPKDGIITVTSSYFRFEVMAANPTAIGVIRYAIDLASIGGNTFDFIEVNGGGFGIVANNACSTCVFQQNIINAPNIHNNTTAGVIISGVTTNQANYGTNIWHVNIASTATCFTTWGYQDEVNAACSAATNGLVFNTGATGNSYNLAYTSGVTGPLTDNGTNNSGFLNGLIKATNAWISAKRLNAIAGNTAALPTCGSATAPEGSLASVTDANSNVWGAGVAGGGTNHILAYCDGSGWTIAGK